MKLLTSRNIIPYQEICVIAITTFKIVRISIIMKIQVPPPACIRIKGEKSFSLSSVRFTISNDCQKYFLSYKTSVCICCQSNGTGQLHGSTYTKVHKYNSIICSKIILFVSFWYVFANGLKRNSVQGLSFLVNNRVY